MRPAAYRCHVCKSVSAFEGDRSVCHSVCSTGGPTTPLFTRYDLVKVAERLCGNGGYEEAEAIVDEMLKDGDG